MGIISYGVTDVGLVRKNNQDTMYMNDDYHLYLVADGMGGHSGGEIASTIAVKAISEFVLDNIKRFTPLELIRNAIKHANQKIFQYAIKNPELKGMGTTVVLLYFANSNLYLANVGDSRAYLINKGCLFQLSRDHSLIQEKINLGIYTREDAAKDKMKNVLVRAVGHEEKVEIDIFTYKVSKNDLFFICSDGLHGKVSDRDTLYLIYKGLNGCSDLNNATKPMIEDTVNSLIAQANCNGGNDNISIIIILAQ